jgi:hypothetical protein
MENKTRRNFVFLPVSQVRTNTFFIVYFQKTHDNPQNTTQKTEDRATRTPLRTGVELRCSGRVGSYVLTVDILIHFFIGCLQRGTCPTIVYSALLYISRCVTGDSIRLAFV